MLKRKVLFNYSYTFGLPATTTSACLLINYHGCPEAIKNPWIIYEYDAEGNRIATNTPEYREEYVYDTVSNLPQVLVFISG